MLRACLPDFGRQSTQTAITQRAGGTIAYWGGAASFEEIFSSIIFDSIDIEGRTANTVMYAMFKSLDDKRTLTFQTNPTESKISHMFANIYTFESKFIAENHQREFYAMKINDENTASLIMHEIIDESPNAGDDEFPFEGHVVMSLHKKPDNMTVNLSDDMAGSVWSAQDGNASFVYADSSIDVYDDEIEVNTLKLTINSVDISDNSLNAVLEGTLQNTEGVADIKTPLKLTWSGYYNMWYGETDSKGETDPQYFSLSLLTKDTAVFVADIYDYDDTKYYIIEISSTLKKENK